MQQGIAKSLVLLHEYYNPEKLSGFLNLYFCFICIWKMQVNYYRKNKKMSKLSSTEILTVQRNLIYHFINLIVS